MAQDVARRAFGYLAAEVQCNDAVRNLQDHAHVVLDEQDADTVRLTQVEDEEYGLQRLTLISRREYVVVARDASPDERARIARGLTSALAKVKKGF